MIWKLTQSRARATSATLRAFKPYSHESSGELFFHEPGNDCIIKAASEEWRAIWPDVAAEDPDLLLSVGTGHSLQPPASAVDNIRARLYASSSRIDPSITRQKEWSNYQAGLEGSQRTKFIRIDPGITNEMPAVDDLSQIEAFSRTIREHPDLNSTVWETAAHLAASFFYFELSDPISELSDGSFVVKGAFHSCFSCDEHSADTDILGDILCRLAPNTPEVRGLGEYLKQYSPLEPKFVIRDHESTGRQCVILQAAITDMIRDRQFILGIQHISLSSRSVVSEIGLQLKSGTGSDEGRTYLISGFPRSLFRDEDSLPRRSCKEACFYGQC
jgi:hypothetical protein